ncbi:MAG: indolepyruvate oxidoreductase subunit beta family protein [Burkholderiaceae bacterium]
MQTGAATAEPAVAPVAAGPVDTPARTAPPAGGPPAVATREPRDTAPPLEPGQSQRISVAIVAMGGQGGGVLSDWIVELARRNAWRVQATSVPGVAQRTGATIYYLELFRTHASEPARDPVLALMPLSGDVDLVVAAEWMEAGRAIQRGLVTPDRTTLVASTHRAYATAEKIVPGNGMADSGKVGDAAREAAARLLAFDMSQIAEQHGSVISASLFGAVAATGVLPFPLAEFEEAIRSGGVGVKASLATLQAAHDRAIVELQAGQSAQDAPAADGAGDDAVPGGPVPASPADEALATPSADQAGSPSAAGDAVPAIVALAGVTLPTGELGERIRAHQPVAAHRFALEGVRRCTDYLDADYAREYLQRLESIVDSPDGSAELATETARWLALRMCYEDPVRVADLKIRKSRFAAIREEVRAEAAQPIDQVEFLHPRLEEVIDTLPAKWGHRIRESSWLSSLVRRRFSRGMTIRTTTLWGFLQLYLLARMRHWRRQSLRHGRESEHIDAWLARVRGAREANPALAVAFARSARLIKGYGDTHAGSLSTYQRIIELGDSLLNRPDAGAILDYLIEAALSDASGDELNAAIAEVARVRAVRADDQSATA